MLLEMVWHQIGAMPFLGSMLNYDRLEHNEQISVKYFALFAHFIMKNSTLFDIFFGILKFCGCLRVNIIMTRG